jgi:biopolymer transport protein ExbD
MLHARRVVAAANEAAHGIDLAPMLDFVVNLLIFFIVTAVFAKQTALSVQRPRAVDELSTKTPWAVVIGANGEVSVDGRVVDLRAVRSNAERMRAERPDDGVVIAASPAAPTGVLVGVVDELHLAGVEDVTFATTR